MTDEQINAAIARACGWTDLFEHPEFGLMGVESETHGCRTGIEHYVGDLNAMHEAENICINTAALEEEYYHFINRNFRATARQRAEGFLRTLGKWEGVQG